jgi:hypothetical protein
MSFIIIDLKVQRIVTINVLCNYVIETSKLQLTFLYKPLMIFLMRALKRLK